MGIDEILAEIKSRGWGVHLQSFIEENRWSAYVGNPRLASYDRAKTVADRSWGEKFYGETPHEALLAAFQAAKKRCQEEVT